MPIFEYICNDCGRDFERLVGVGAGNGSGLSCPACGSSSTRKLFSRFAVRSVGGDGSAISSSSGCSSCHSSNCATCN